MTGRHRRPSRSPVPLLLQGGLAVGMTVTLWFMATPPAAPVAEVITTTVPLPPTTSPPLLTPAATTPPPSTTPRTTPPATTTPPRTSSYRAAPSVTTPAPTTQSATSEMTSESIGVVAAAQAYLDEDIPYQWGGKDESGMDCSGFIWNVLRDAGIEVQYRSSAALASWVDQISPSEATGGDLVFWPGHVGLYLGDRRMIDMARSTGTITERTIWRGATFGRVPS